MLCLEHIHAHSPDRLSTDADHRVTMTDAQRTRRDMMPVKSVLVCLLSRLRGGTILHLSWPLLALQRLASSSKGGASCGCSFYFLTILPTIINPDTGLGQLWFRPVVWLLAKIDSRFFSFLPRGALTVVPEPMAVSIFKTQNSQCILWASRMLCVD